MKTCLIDRACLGKAAVLARLARDLEFPAHFAANLDALHDVLTTDIEGPITITWREARIARAAMGPDFDRLAAVLRAAAERRRDLTLTIEF